MVSIFNVKISFTLNGERKFWSEGHDHDQSNVPTSGGFNNHFIINIFFIIVIWWIIFFIMMRSFSLCCRAITTNNKSSINTISLISVQYGQKVGGWLTLFEICSIFASLFLIHAQLQIPIANKKMTKTWINCFCGSF